MFFCKNWPFLLANGDGDTERDILKETDPGRCPLKQLCWFCFMPGLWLLTAEGCHSHPESLN